MNAPRSPHLRRAAALALGLALVGGHTDTLMANDPTVTDPDTPASTPGADAVLAVQRALSEAVLGGDRAAAAEVLAEDFVGIGHVGNAVGRERYLDVHFSPERDFTRFESSDAAVIAVGDAFVLTGRFHVTNALADAPAATYRFSAAIGPEDDGALRIFSWQETPITNESF